MKEGTQKWSKAQMQSHKTNKRSLRTQVSCNERIFFLFSYSIYQSVVCD
jgi:hypothetical protein